MKKFEEGIFSDLRHLKPGVDASLEEPNVSFCSLLFWSDFFVFVPLVGIVDFPSSPRRASDRFDKELRLSFAVRSFSSLWYANKWGERGGMNGWVVQCKAIYAFLLFPRKKGRIHFCHPTSPPLITRTKQKLRLFSSRFSFPTFFSLSVYKNR